MGDGEVGFVGPLMMIKLAYSDLDLGLSFSMITTFVVVLLEACFVCWWQRWLSHRSVT